MTKRLEMRKITGVGLPNDDGWDDIDIKGDVVFNEIDMTQIASLVPDACMQSARKFQVRGNLIKTETLSRFLDMFPNLTTFFFYSCRFEDQSFYKVFENRPIKWLYLELFENDSVCFDSLNTLENLETLKIINLNSAEGLDQITPNLKRLTIKAPDLTMDQCLCFRNLDRLETFSEAIEPETDYPRLSELMELKYLTMPVYGNNFRFLPDMPDLEEFNFQKILESFPPRHACVESGFAHEDGDFEIFPQLNSLSKLDLSLGDMSVQSLEQVIPKVPKLKKLNLWSNRVKNDSLLCIADLKELESCYFGTKVKGSTMKKLASALPNCKFEL